MPENNMESPSDAASNNAKARWSIRKALRENPDGLSKDGLVQRVRADWPECFENHRGRQAVGAALENMKRGGEVNRDAVIQKWKPTPSLLARVPEFGRESEEQSPESAGARGVERESRKSESEWYQPVADALVNMGTCTSAVSVGDGLNGPKWTNPDVVGLITPGVFTRAYNFPVRQLVAVEIKRTIDPNSLLVGFAEACAYLEFAHISWLVVPWCDDDNDTIERLERMCLIHGLGLAYAHEDNEDGEYVFWLDVGVHPRSQKPDERMLEDFLKRVTGKGYMSPA